MALLLAFAHGVVPAHEAEDPRQLLQSNQLPDSAVWLDTLEISHVRQDWGFPRAGRSVGRNVMRLDGTVYHRGVGTHAFSECHIELYGAAKRFLAMTGIDDEVGSAGSAVFEVWVDGALQWKSPVLHGGDPPALADVELVSAQRLVLIVDPTEDGVLRDHANWAGALLILDESTARQPRIVAPPPLDPPPVAKCQPTSPEINAPRVVGATPGNPFRFRIPCAGELPLHFTVHGLPPGLALEARTGVLSGIIEDPDIHELEILAANSHGEARQKLLLVVAPHALTLTPPMGWNSWNVWGETVDDPKVRAAADALVATRLADYGFQYVCIDDGWAGGRDAHGAIVPNDKFPDMPGLVHYVHGHGLKAGIYTSPGRTTCAGYEGSFQHEFRDARTFAEWGMDFLKYDWCSYGGVAEGEGREMFVRPYRLMREALDACGRDIVYSICQYGVGNVWEWAASSVVGGNLWRTTEDITDTWSSLVHNARATAAIAHYARPGHWNDADMMVLGTLGWGGELRETRLSQREQHTHVTLWVMLPSPMILGCDVGRLDACTLALLRNPEIIGVHQDPSGVPARRTFKSDDGAIEVWIRPLWDSTYAVGVFNFDRRGGAREVRVSWTGLGIPERRYPVRDLWRREDLETGEDGLTVHVSERGSALLQVGAPIAEAAAMAALRRQYEDMCGAGTD